MLRRLFYFVVAGLLLAGCDPEQRAGDATAAPDAWLPLRIGEVPLEAQFAVSQAEQQRGLMHRTSLPPDGGMLFLYRQPQQMSFWMANTPLPLDIGFFDRDGVLLEIHRMLPYDTTPVRSHSSELQFALEMRSGWFRGKGLLPGARMDLALVADGLRQRGTPPAEYGLGGD